jgi:hypothetical protein
MLENIYSYVFLVLTRKEKKLLCNYVFKIITHKWLLRSKKSMFLLSDLFQGGTGIFVQIGFGYAQALPRWATLSPPTPACLWICLQEWAL